MKLIITVVFLFSLNVNADSCVDTNSQEKVENTKEINTDVPKHLQDAVIIVRTKDGRESVVSANKFKVVPRKQQFIVTETSKHTQRVCKVSRDDKNLVIVGGRRDHTGLSKSINGNTGVLSSDRGLVMDAGYMRQNVFDSNLGIGGSVDTNGTLRGTVGISF
jgi:hypothetical protein